ncbi:hypothetical protein [Oceanospirillum sediminis]|uniref:Uncharacterized protein n=1 Tax=Oceanospirillum sediminis TaxID=2760088 RepID=A0A839IVK8_9GAMM|nr:hypothetical protein [Oceanospirillum sediminis]MBB1489473.1 hypothetical protein [Oceanospirillum sediminis]
MRLIWLITTAVLFTASSYFSVRLLLQLADDTATGIAYGAVAIALALVQYAALPYGIRSWSQGRHFSASVYFVTWALLTLLSIAASAGALIGDTQQQQHRQHTGSLEYQLLTSQIRQLQLQADSIQATAKTDSENGYRSRALKTLDKLPAIQQQISELRLQLSALPASSNTAVSALFERIARQLKADPDQVMTGAYLLVAVLIELALTVSVSALSEGMAMTVTPVATASTHTATENNTLPETADTQRSGGHAIPSPQTTIEPGTLTARLKSLIRPPDGRPVTS